MPDLIRCPTLATVPVHYARLPVAPYGTRGKPRSPRCTPEFKALVEACVQHLGRVHPLGLPELLVTAGMYVSGKQGPHGDGHAIDIDALWWTGATPLVALHAPQDARWYLATEAVLRQHFGVVLNHHYNRPHRDHWHCDDRRAVGWAHRRGNKALTVWAQGCLVYVLGQDVGNSGDWGDGLDRVYGRRTRAAVKRVMGDARALEDAAGFVAFCDQVVGAAWG